ncbi:MAG: hypothetical protein AAF722_07545 [Cyanobacteria bacterium P01_C01_bin.70]
MDDVLYGFYCCQFLDNSAPWAQQIYAAPASREKGDRFQIQIAETTGHHQYLSIINDL